VQPAAVLSHSLQIARNTQVLGTGDKDQAPLIISSVSFNPNDNRGSKAVFFDKV
jgi:hypothetical protein